MKDSKIFKVGNKIVRFGQVYRIFKIEKKKGLNGKKEKTVFFRPYFKSEDNKTLVYSLPVKSLDKVKIREPISKRELRKLLKELTKKSDIKIPVDATKAREELKLNEPHKSMEVLRLLWREKNDESKNFAKSKQDIFKLSIKQLVEEVAFVSGLSLTKAKRKIKKALGKGIKSDK